MSRRILLLLLVLSSLLMFSSCKKGREVFLIGISQPSMDAWREKANEELCREASFYNDVNVEIRSVADDSKAQIDDIEYFIEKGVPVKYISPINEPNWSWGEGGYPGQDHRAGRHGYPAPGRGPSAAGVSTAPRPAAATGAGAAPSRPASVGRPLPAHASAARG